MSEDKAKNIQCPICDGEFDVPCSFCHEKGKVDIVRLEDHNQEVEKYKNLYETRVKYLLEEQETTRQIIKAKAELEQRLERIRQLEEEYFPRFAAMCKAGPPSDYSDLWHLAKEFRNRLKTEVSTKEEKKELKE